MAIPQKYHTALNWADYGELKEFLSGQGYYAEASESEDDLREELRRMLIEEEIEQSDLDWLVDKYID